HSADVADVLPRGDLGNDAAPLAMDLSLRRDDVGSHPPRARRIAGRRDDRGAGLVTRRLDAEDNHGECGDQEIRRLGDWEISRSSNLKISKFRLLVKERP